MRSISAAKVLCLRVAFSYCTHIVIRLVNFNLFYEIINKSFSFLFSGLACMCVCVSVCSVPSFLLFAANLWISRIIYGGGCSCNRWSILLGEVGEIMLCARFESVHYIRQGQQQQQRQFHTMRKNIISIQRIIRADSSYEFTLTASVHTKNISVFVSPPVRGI